MIEKVVKSPSWEPFLFTYSDTFADHTECGNWQYC